MGSSANRRSLMTLFSGPTCPASHRIRLILAEKGITAEVEEVDAEPPEDLVDLNPYASVPTLVDRDVALYSPDVIGEYLDERFPHPPLMPVDPVSRARTRLVLFRVERDWYSLAARIEAGGAEGESARKQLRESLTAGGELFAGNVFFLSDDFSALDCAVVPLLWRLPHLGIELPRQAAPVLAYAERMFAREAFQSSLSRAERAMRPAY